MLKGFVGSTLVGLLFFAASPTSTNYVLPSYDIGNGGTDNSSSTNYRLNGTAGTQTGDSQNSTSYKINGGENPTQDASVPPTPTLTNPSSYYDRLLLVVNQGGNPSDTKYLVAISNDNFVTTRYVQADNSIGSTYTLATFRTYGSYGGGSGFLILGLTPSTTYKVKVKAIRGNFTESGYGPATTGVATVAQSLSFGLTTTLTGTPPFTANFASLTSGSVITANADINIALSTNASVGGAVYLSSANGGLTSVSASYSLNSATADLALASSGYGGQIISTSQSSGGPFTAQSPYNGTSDNVGILTTNLQQLLTSGSPIDTATAVFRLKAKSEVITPSATDFVDTLSLVAAMNY